MSIEDFLAEDRYLRRSEPKRKDTPARDISHLLTPSTPEELENMANSGKDIVYAEMLYRFNVAKKGRAIMTREDFVEFCDSFLHKTSLSKQMFEDGEKVENLQSKADNFQLMRNRVQEIRAGLIEEGNLRKFFGIDK